MEQQEINNSFFRSFGRTVRVLCFLAGGMILFCLLQRLFIPKLNYPVMLENVSYTLEGFYSLEKNTQDVLFLGTSHMEFGVSPVEIYRNEGFSSYNLATSGQGLAATFFLLRDALERQSPKAVVLDVSGLFLEDKDLSEASWKYILDAMPLSRNKTAMLSAFREFKESRDGQTKNSSQEPAFSEEGEEEYEKTGEEILRDPDGFLSADNLRNGLFPFFVYHDRWSELSGIDFRDYLPSDESYGAGYFPYSRMLPSPVTIEEMNQEAEELSAEGVRTVREHTDGILRISETEDHPYQTGISPANDRWLRRIMQLCGEKGTQLLLIKIPAVYHPRTYKSAWTRIRSDYMKNYAQEKGLSFLDLLYDADIGLDLDRDFIDGGMHLNYLGAGKVSGYLGKYLREHCSVPPKDNKKMEEDLPMYVRMTETAQLQLETDFQSYLRRIGKDIGKYTVCIAAKDDMSYGLSESDITALRELGLEADFGVHPGLRESYLAIVDRGAVLYEAASNHALEYELAENEKYDLHVTSSGWMTFPVAEIQVNKTNEAVNSIGVNIVVIDAATGLVIDSVAFNTYLEEHTCIRKDPTAYLNEYWMAVRQSERSGDRQ